MTVFQVASKRFNTIATIIGEVQGRILTVVFYFTILVPFGIISRLFNDPLKLRDKTPRWVKREPTPTDMKSAQEQG